MKIILIFLLTFSSIISASPDEPNEKNNTVNSLISLVLDFIPIVGNIKCLGESITGKDLITGEELNQMQRTLSFIGAIPFGNYLTFGKHFKNGKKFIKVAKRVVGKIKNASFQRQQTEQ